jgi:hypothetical protein
VPAPGEVTRLEQRIGKLENKIENVVRAVEAIAALIAASRAAVVTREQPYIGAGR